MYYCAPLQPPSRGAAPRVPAGSHTAHPIADSHVMAMAPAQLNSKSWLDPAATQQQPVIFMGLWPIFERPWFWLGAA